MSNNVNKKKSKSLTQDNKPVPSKVQITSQTAILNGPVPHPSIIKEYENILEGSAERIFKWAEDEKAHRHKNEKLIIESEIALRSQGQKYGFYLGVLGLIMSGVIILKGHSVAGAIFGGGTLVALVSVFVLGKKIQNKEESEDSNKLN